MNLREGSRLEVEELRAWAAPMMARYMLPTELVIVDTLPRNAASKVCTGIIREISDSTTQIESQDDARHARARRALQAVSHRP